MGDKRTIEEFDKDVDTFRTELTELINKHSMDSYVNTNDFIIASHMINSMTTLYLTISKHDKMRGNEREHSTREHPVTKDNAFTKLDQIPTPDSNNAIIYDTYDEGSKGFVDASEAAIEAGIEVHHLINDMFNHKPVTVQKAIDIYYTMQARPFHNEECNCDTCVTNRGGVKFS